MLPRTASALVLASLVSAALATAPAAQPDADDGAAGDEPAAEAPTEEVEVAPAEELDLDALRQRYHALRDRLFQSRARAAAVASALYSSRLRIDLRYDSARFFTVTRATVRLDGASVYDDVDGAIASDRAPRFEGFVAPGRHLVTVRIEAVAKDDERFASTVEHAFAVQAPAGKDLVVSAVAEDDGSIAQAWTKAQRGSYQLHLDVKVEATDPGARGGESIQRTGRLRGRDAARAQR